MKKNERNGATDRDGPSLERNVRRRRLEDEASDAFCDTATALNERHL